jgi:phosphate:Na+ symporter
MRIRGRGLTAASNCGAVQIEKGTASVTEALEKMLKFMSGVSGPPETASGEAAFTTTKGGPEDVGAAELCAEAIQCAGEVPADPADIGRASPIEARRNRTGSTEAERRSLRPQSPPARGSRQCAGALRLAHRSATLGKVATGELTADDAIARVDAVARLEALVRQAWRSATHLGAGGE